MVAFITFEDVPNTNGSIFVLFPSGMVRGATYSEWLNKGDLYPGYKVLVSKSAAEYAQLAALDRALKA